MQRVLLVDDDPSILFVLKDFVSEHGWEPVLARSGLEALGLLDRADAVVTDLCMPGMDGIELLGAIRSRDEILPVILVTGQCTERLAARAMRAGAYGCLPKPFDAEELATTVQRALEVRRHGARPRRDANET